MTKTRKKSLEQLVYNYADKRNLDEEEVHIREHRDGGGEPIAVTLSHRTDGRLRDHPEKFGWIGTGTGTGFLEVSDPDLYESNDGNYFHLDEIADWPEEIIMEYLVQAGDAFGWPVAQQHAPTGWRVSAEGEVSRD